MDPFLIVALLKYLKKISLYLIIWTLLTFLAGFGLGQFYLSFALHSSTSIATWIGIAFGLIVTVLTAWKKAFRCCTVLCLLELASGLGRTILFSLVTWLVLERPLTTITLNLKEVSSMVQCLGNLSEEQSRHLVNAQLDTYDQITTKMIENLQNWNEVSALSKNSFNEMMSAVNTTEKSVKSAQKTLASAALKCSNDMSNEYSKCKSTMSSGKNKCLHFLSSSPIFTHLAGLCDILDGASYLCEAFNADVCKPLTLLTTELNLFDDLTKMLKDLRSLFDLKLTIKKNVHGSTNASEAIHFSVTEVNEKFSNMLDSVLYVINTIHYMITIICVLMLPIKAACFLSSNKSPRVEVDSESTMNEGGNTSCANIALGVKLVMATFVAILFTGTLLAVDYTLHWALIIARTHGNLSIGIAGNIDVGADIEGGDFMRPLVQMFFDGIKMIRNYTISVSSESCLPNPVAPSPVDSYWTVALVYAFMVILAFSNVYLLSKRVKIVRWFYPMQSNVDIRVMYKKRHEKKRCAKKPQSTSHKTKRKLKQITVRAEQDSENSEPTPTPSSNSETSSDNSDHETVAIKMTNLSPKHTKRPMRRGN